MNRELFEQIRDEIAAYPEHLRMEQYLSGGNPEQVAKHECGTAACICGWAIALTGTKIRWTDDFHSIGISLLGLTDAEGDKVFEVSEWPMPFVRDYKNASRRDKAFVAVAYINHILENGVPA